MATNYIKKINDLPIAASQAAPGSELAQRLSTLESGSFAVVPLTSTEPIVPNPSGASPAVPLSNKIIYLTYISSATGDDKYKEWIYTGDPTAVDNTKWVQIGDTTLDLSNYKTKQTAKTSPTASGDTLAFIDTITQDANGEITATKKNLTIDSSLSSTSTNPVQNSVINAALSGKKNTQSAVSDPTASGTSITFIDSISQDAQGVITPTKKTVSTMSGASALQAGTGGLVPAPGAGKNTSFLRGDGVWTTTDDKNVRQSTTSTSGNYPILASAKTNPTTGMAYEAIYGPGISINPTTNTINATNFNGTATTAKDYSNSGGIATALAGKKDLQTPVTSSTTGNTPTLTFVSKVTQNAQGVITVLKDTVKIDTSINASSTNPVQNKTITSELSKKYVKPNDGIPSTDLASAVQSSLDAADTAVQGILLPDSLTELTPDSSKKITLPLVSSTSGGEAGLMSSGDKVKLDGIAAGAEANVQSDWNQTTTTADDYIKNKPTLGTAASKDVASSGNASTTQVVMGNDTRLTNARTPTSHTHGNITNVGGITATGVEIADGDALVIVDASETNKLVAKTSITFDGSTTTQALTKKGTFATFYQKPSGGIPSTDLASAVQKTLGNAVQGVTVNGSSVVNSNKVAVISLADSTSTSGPGTAGVVTLEIVSI